MSDRRDDPADELLPEVVDSAAGRSPTRRQQGLDAIAREGARRMLALALEAEVADYIMQHQERDEHGRAAKCCLRSADGRARRNSTTLTSAQEC